MITEILKINIKKSAGQSLLIRSTAGVSWLKHFMWGVLLFTSPILLLVYQKLLPVTNAVGAVLPRIKSQKGGIPAAHEPPSRLRGIHEDK